MGIQQRTSLDFQSRSSIKLPYMEMNYHIPYFLKQTTI
ncbi:hypothetical protein T11_13210 [Trichinella zimbabwensis]|uniref:Uncharacterized protein n=1 Tax=Trichinella zimbabwensis TaxID=268475 RepID=A0A0V1GB86_9BILA|nr:hypothetical protein T11_13210 [Trichinella zimbabwensis]